MKEIKVTPKSYETAAYLICKRKDNVIKYVNNMIYCKSQCILRHESHDVTMNEEESSDLWEIAIKET